ncbi:PQQ-dependent sugar dehydrogenase [Rathayibacter sp. YIM 133350]|uniref:PQQ-dependent sugar dehydrogenase n=1 Tax=Rathayibacter sp. YIM 133350 TaxID=3131992 RepID=UPI00307E09F9
MRLLRTAAIGAALAVLLTGCVSAPRVTPITATPTPRPTGTSTPVAVLPPVQPSGDPVEVASDLDVPWSIVRLPSGATLLSQRDAGTIVELLPDGSTREVAEIDGVEANGEGGLLGLAAAPDARTLFAYFTASDDNRIVRMPLTDSPGAVALGDPHPILTGLAKAANHDGGRIAFGPDGMLYATVGDAASTDRAQDQGSLNGKILRMTPDGGVPDGNPFGTLVWSMGHRNPQGLAWDSHGRLWASEFGQNTWDELNLITPGGNYGWPIVEGIAHDGRFIDPVAQWNTSEASPSGLAIISDTLFMASLRGERIWSIQPDTGAAPEPWFTDAYGRIRDAAAGPDGSLWFVTNNTDGRGDPRDGDDRLYQVALAPAGG